METCLLWLNLFADLLCLLVLALRSKSSLAAENLFLRKQLAFYQERRIKPQRTSHPTRLTLLWLSRWFNWRSALTVVTPKTFISWQRKGFQLFWRMKCQSGRPRIPPELQRLIRKMARENPRFRGANYKRVVAETRPARFAAHNPEVFAGVAGRTSPQPSPRSALVNLSQESRRRHHSL
jgi:hypothetical protein